MFNNFLRLREKEIGIEKFIKKITDYDKKNAIHDLFFSRI
jgi:hypothetical protein